VITELPIGVWTMNYLAFLEELLDGDKKKKQAIIKDFVNISTEIHVHITIQFEKGKKAELESVVDSFGVNGLEKALKLTSSANTNNMNMFNETRQLHKYNSAQEIIDAHFVVRLEAYQKRKAAVLQNKKIKLQELSNRARFIQEIVANTMDLRKFSDDDETDSALEMKKYDKVDDKYDYLTRIPMHNMNRSRVTKILEEKEELVLEIDVLEKTTVETMWLLELDILEKEYGKYKEMRRKLLESSRVTNTKNGKATKKK
jgi:DNA topoisomerase-2